MALHDKRGVPVSTESRESLDRLETATELLLGYFADPLAAIDEALAENPAFVMGHCFRAGLFLISSERGAEPELRRSLEAAEALARKANDRERGHMAAARAWLEGDFHEAVERYSSVLIDHPRDIFALQMAHLGDFFLGQSVMLRDRVARVLPDWDEAVPGFGYVLGMHAFGLEESNQYGRAEATGRRALALMPRDPWAVHAVAHVMEMQGRLADGIEWLTSRTDDWAPENMFAFHNWWHLALYHLDLGQTDRVLQLYDEAIRPKHSAVALEMLDAAALLWRLHLRGVDVGNRWAELADTYEPMAEDAYYTFNDMHAMMAFVADGREEAAKRLLAALERRITGGGTNGVMTREVGLPVCRAIQAFGKGDYATTVDLLLLVRTIAHRFGGSHAQRDVLSQTLIEAALRDNQGRLARALMAERTDLKPTSPYNWLTTARALDLLGHRIEANRANAKAAALLPRQASESVNVVMA
ncbi:tetratricopeptide repeat protein [Rhodospirillaceae bacterium SYSU D60014]|uniref:tetratricopeptide repeat protein n=1 Tax=Virgifigura deserti TaxID=2268457 RepID=UPI000E66FD5E